MKQLTRVSRGGKHGPPGIEKLSKFFGRHLTSWQVFAMSILSMYAARNFSALVGLAGPEPMANMYDPTYFRATWVLTAMDAGFWTAMPIRMKWLRDIAGIFFSLFYLVAAERADEKVRKVRGAVTVDHLRVAWNKGTTPYLKVLQTLMRPRFTKWPPRQVRIPRPANSDYKEPVSAWLYYDGPLADLEHHTKLILDIPGGGFVAMDPRCNDDKLFAWASKSSLPILSLDYKKAPEYPYPYALNECFDVYATLIRTKGKCIGMSGRDTPRIIVTGDSAGGNLAVASTLMILETSSTPFRRAPRGTSLPAPDGLVCFYPALDMNIGNWMTDEQMSLIRDKTMRKTNRLIVRKKSRQYNDLVGTPHHSDEEDDKLETENGHSQASDPLEQLRGTRPEFSHSRPQTLATDKTPDGKEGVVSHRSEPLTTRLATSSMISYVNDRVLTPEMMRAMIILYIGPHNRPDFTQDYFLSPVLAPEYLLAKFPKTYFMTGERDPLVDDTVIFAGRLRRAKEAAARPTASGTYLADARVAAEELPEVLLIPGTSHGFMQFPGIYPPAWKHFERSAGWFDQLFIEAEQARRRRARGSMAARRTSRNDDTARHYSLAESSGDEDRPLEIGMTKIKSRGNSSRSNSPEESGQVASNGDANDDEVSKRRKKLSKHKSLVKLNSTDDLLSRRMQGVASGLTGPAADD